MMGKSATQGFDLFEGRIKFEIFLMWVVIILV